MATTYTVLFTRQDYLNSDPTIDPNRHERYYSQLVTPHVVRFVVNAIGMNRLLASKDEHLNDIPLKEWDRLTYVFQSMPEYHSKLKQLGDYATLSGNVCTLKCAAKMAIEEHHKQHS